MKKFLFILNLIAIPFLTVAHQPDISSTMLVENANGEWMLHIRASLTAFQQEIKTHYSEQPYTTPEEFMEQVLNHVQNNVLVSINGGDALTLSNGQVKLGHETSVFFQVHDIPDNLKSIAVTNTCFKDIHHNQSALYILKSGFDKKQFTLNEANHYSIKLAAQGNSFNLKENVKTTNTPFGIYILVLVLVLIGTVPYLVHYSKKRNVTQLV